MEDLVEKPRNLKKTSEPIQKETIMTPE